MGVDRDGIEDYHTTKVAMHSLSLFLSLADSLLDNGHCSYIDHWYTSIEIWDILNEMC